ncbi:MAG: sugar transferase [Anaerolineae bacterium]
MRASVVIPAFNAASTIERCLQAVSAQSISATDYEIIVVDDGSTDDTSVQVRQFAQVRLEHTAHLGAAGARNFGARAAVGDVLLFTDADCEPTWTWIQEMLAPFGDSLHSVVGAKGVYLTRQRAAVARFVQIEYEEKYEQMRRWETIDFVDTYSAAYRRDLFLANDGFDESFPAASVEDQEFSFRLAKQGYRLVMAPQAVVYHSHVTTARAYGRRKFRIGYWKVRVHRRHPDKMWRDSHTPPTLKFQVACVMALAGTIGLTFWFPMAGWLVAGGFVALIASSLPLLRFVARRDPALVAVASGLIAVRAVALAAGLVAGVIGEVARNAQLKRGLDIFGALLGLGLTAPLMLVVAVAIKLDSPGPALYAQQRAGQNGRPFRILKFRSMIDGADQMLNQVIPQSQLPPPAYKIHNDPRVTRVGRFLRRWSLDELPQFWNVLTGDMSLVGPRPEEVAITAQYNESQRRRLLCKPGLTGPMQVNGRGDLSLDERVQVELDYIRDASIWKDLVLLCKTIPAVIGRRGAY